MSEYRPEPLRLTTNLIMNALLDDGTSAIDYPTIKQDYGAVKKAIEAFEEYVWFGGLQGYVQQATIKGHRCKTAEHIDILLYAIAGRVLITFRDERNRSELTIITAEDGDRRSMGMQSIDATLEQVDAFLVGAIRLHRVGALLFEPYEDATII